MAAEKTFARFNRCVRKYIRGSQSARLISKRTFASLHDGHGYGMSHNEESDRDALKASDVNTDRPGSKPHPPGSGDREERDIVRAAEKLDQAGGGH